MNDQNEYLEQIWDGILSREEDRIRQTYLALDKNSRIIVLEHIKKMTSEQGWHPEQVKSAGAALEVILKINRD